MTKWQNKNKDTQKVPQAMVEKHEEEVSQKVCDGLENFYLISSRTK